MTRSIALSVLFWSIAALLVAAAPMVLDSAPIATVLLKIAAIAVVAFGFMKVTRNPSSLNQALTVGVVWLLLDIFTEILVTSHTGHEWRELLGSPAVPALRAVVLLAWLAAPALFVRRSQAR